MLTPEAATGSLLRAPTIEKVVELFVRIHHAVVSTKRKEDTLEMSSLCLMTRRTGDTHRR